MFITYSLLIAALKKATLQTIDDQNVDTSNGSASDLPDPRQQGVLPGTRLFQVVEWLAGADKTGNCLIILDECHKAKNLIAREGRVQHVAILQIVCLPEPLLSRTPFCEHRKGCKRLRAGHLLANMRSILCCCSVLPQSTAFAKVHASGLCVAATLFGDQVHGISQVEA